MPDELPSIPEFVRRYFVENDLGRVLAAEPLQGGVISFAYRLRTERGQTFFLKRSVNFPEDMYRIEAEGLAKLTATGIRTPEVLSFSPEHLLLEDLGSRPPDKRFWPAFGRAVARLHENRAEKFGFDHHNYLGRLKMTNTWTDDGHEFFIHHRILRFLEEPLVDETLTTEDRRGIERIAVRLPMLVPADRPSLLHGDLWLTNMLADPDGNPAVIDPSVYYGWPEADLSMSWLDGKVPMEFFESYREVHPLADGWGERLELLLIKEYLSMVAHFADAYGSVAKLRAILEKFG